ncbi:hypothetical protein [Streptomyces albipurpureus]|uniref:Uncharacterized protein n=1 Tax=Streptomyces albipurpureus TaxID=2897419 RepID=A0ABT0V1W4_9ACTN|nr:hypothetical protein [Streptomyces sp. CWNU-1]MCM2393865.1 hypothetical protein [Streptomyces sp. CWNU-1]
MTLVLGVLLVAALGVIGVLFQRQRSALPPSGGPVHQGHTIPYQPAPALPDPALTGRIGQLERELAQQRAGVERAAGERDAARVERDQAAAARDGALAERSQLAADRDRAAAERDQAQFQAVKATRDKERAEDDSARLLEQMERLRTEYEEAHQRVLEEAEHAREAQQRAEDSLREFDLHEDDHPWLPSDLQQMRLISAGGAVEPSLRESDRPTPTVPQQLSLSQDATADTLLDGADLGGVIVRAASVCGDRHRRRQQHRRDAVLLRVPVGLGGSALLSAVAAGAPDGAWSQSAAAHACRALVTQVQNQADVLAPWLAGPTTARAGDQEPPAEDLSGPAAALRLALSDVRRAIQVEAKSRGWLSERGTADDRAVGVALTGLLSPLGDRESRTHLAFGAGDGMVLRLRDGEWSTVFPVQDAGPGGGTLPSAEVEFRWDPIPTQQGDLLAVCSKPTAELLLQEVTGAWFAERWAGRQPRLTSFMLHVSARIRAAVEDRSLVCVWDYGNAAEAERVALSHR